MNRNDIFKRFLNVTFHLQGKKLHNGCSCVTVEYKWSTICAYNKRQQFQQLLRENGVAMLKVSSPFFLIKFHENAFILGT